MQFLHIRINSIFAKSFKEEQNSTNWKSFVLFKIKFYLHTLYSFYMLRNDLLNK